MSNDKYDAITGSGIEVGERVKIPDDLVPADAKVEMEAKIAAGYFTDDLARGFQVSERNPMTGLEGRAALIARLGKNAQDNPAVFAVNEDARPGGLFDHPRTGRSGRAAACARDIARCAAAHGGDLAGSHRAGRSVPRGHLAASRDRRGDETNGLMPFHKLSQWLTYSLLEPLQGRASR
jgi:hypothetical protein